MKSTCPDFASDLFSFISRSVTPYHAQEEVIRLLLAAGFREEPGKGQADKPYFKRLAGASLMAVIPGRGPLKDESPRLLLSHLDGPAFKVKEVPDDYQDLARLNVSAYGGLRKASFTDRPLSLAGRAYLARNKAPGGLEDGLEERNFLSPRTLVIPSLAVHLEKEEKSSLQTHYPALWSSKEKTLKDHLAELLSCTKEDLLAHDAFLVVDQPPRLLAEDEDLFLAPRIDDLAMAYAQLSAFTADRPQGPSRFAFFLNHEEIGSLTEEGAFSSLLLRALEGYSLEKKESRADFLAWLGRSQILSLDVSHGYHASYPQAYDKKTSPHLGQGPAIKRSAAGKYGLSSRLYAQLKAGCLKKKIDLQVFENHSDLKGGSTMGPMAAAITGGAVLDLGAPILAMHAALEVADIRDIEATREVIDLFLDLA